MKKFLRAHWLHLAYLLTSLMSFFWPFFLIFPIFVFPAALLVRTTKNNFLYTVFLIFSINILFFIFYMGLADLIKIPLYGATIAALNLLASICLLFFTIRGASFQINIRSHVAEIRYVLAIYLLFILAFVIRVVSVAKYPAPILHDPVADAVWTKSILTNHGINYFYSPGLHLVTAFFSKAASLSVPHALNLVTNSFNAFSVLSWGLVVLLVTRKGPLALLVSFLTFIVPVPSMLYINSGKNALVMAIAFMPLMFFALYRLYKEQSVFNSGLLFMLLASLFLIHYPTFGYTFLAVASIIFLSTLPRLVKRTEFEEVASVRLLWLSIIAVLVFLACWFAFQNKGLADNNGGSKPINLSQSLSISPSEFKSAAKDTYQEFASYSRLYSTYYMPLLAVGLIYLFSQKRNKVWLTGIIFGFWVAAVPFLVQLLQLYPYDIIRSSGILLLFQVFVLIVSLAAYNIAKTMKLESWSRYVYAVLFIIITGWFSYHQLSLYRNQTASLETVNSYDLAAYKWINSNVSGGFLINEAQPPHGHIIFPTDGGMWLPVYTNTKVSDNFSDNNQRTDSKFYSLYTNISRGEKVKESIDTIKSSGYQYYYYDQGVFGAPISPAIVEPYTKLVYSNPQVSIYKFN